MWEEGRPRRVHACHTLHKLDQEQDAGQLRSTQHTHTQTNTQMHKHTHRRTNTHTHRHTHRRIDTHTHRHTHRRTNADMPKLTYGQTESLKSQRHTPNCLHTPLSGVSCIDVLSASVSCGVVLKSRALHAQLSTLTLTRTSSSAAFFRKVSFSHSDIPVVTSLYSEDRSFGAGYEYSSPHIQLKPLCINSQYIKRCVSKPGKY